MSPAHYQLRRPTRRSIVLLVLALIVGVCGVIDKRATLPKPASAAALNGAAPASASSSAWYCPLLTVNPADAAASSITVLNPQATALSGNITFVAVGGTSATVPVNIAPRTRQLFYPASSITDTWASALVRLAGGGASVTQFVKTSAGDVSTACAPSASQNWYFADGSTESGASLQIGVFNPFNDDAIVDASFLTSEGVAQPEAFQGVIIPPMKMVVLDVSGNVRRRDFVASSITLRTGRVAVAQLQTGVMNGNPVAGYTVGAPALSLSQYLPDIQTQPGRHSNLVLFNPNDSESDVEVDNVLDAGGAPPFELHVPAGGRAQVSFDSESRIPPNTHMGAFVQVKNGVPITSQLTVTAVPPAPTAGGDFMTGIADVARQWVLAGGPVDAATDAWVYVLNPNLNAVSVRVTLTGDGNSSTQAPVKINPRQRYAFHVNDLSPNGAASVVVTSDQDVAVSREFDVAPGPNLSIEPAVAVRQ